MRSPRGSSSRRRASRRRLATAASRPRSEPPVEGREFVPRRGLSGRRQAVRLIAGEEGITLIQPDEEPVTVRFGSIAAAVHERPGQITLIARDASFIEFEFGRLRDGDELERLVLDRLPPPGAVPGPAFEAARAVDALAERDLEPALGRERRARPARRRAARRRVARAPGARVAGPPRGPARGHRPPRDVALRRRPQRHLLGDAARRRSRTSSRRRASPACAPRACGSEIPDGS